MCDVWYVEIMKCANDDPANAKTERQRWMKQTNTKNLSERDGGTRHISACGDSHVLSQIGRDRGVGTGIICCKHYEKVLSSVGVWGGEESSGAIWW